MDPADQIITFETYYDPMLAEIIRGRLEASGIPCYLADENINTIMPIYNQLTGGVKIRGFSYDLERARQLIAENNDLEAEEISTEVCIACPHCGSTNVRYGQATETKVGFFTAVVSFLLMVYPFYAKKAWHCFKCGKDFQESIN